MRAVDYLYRERGFEEVHVYGEREASVVALFAAALDERVKAVTLFSLPSTLTSASNFNYPVSLLPPNLLKYADIPEVAAMVAPRPFAPVNPLDSHLRPMVKEEAEKCFEFTREIYAAAGAQMNFSVDTIESLN